MGVNWCIPMCRWVYWFVVQLKLLGLVKQPLVQTLVVVANIQIRFLKTEVEKGSMWTVFGHGLADPKSPWLYLWCASTGDGPKICQPGCDQQWQQFWFLQCKQWAQMALSFLYNWLVPWKQIVWRGGGSSSITLCILGCLEHHCFPWKSKMSSAHISCSCP